jgi:ABC-type Fe3+ transport system permease subunit
MRCMLFVLARTMPVAIYCFLVRPGATNYGQALAMSTLLMLVCTLGFLAIERLSRFLTPSASAGSSGPSP